MNGVNASGYHAHFLSRDKTKGGHVLECAVGSAEVMADDISRFEMILPVSADFYGLTFSQKANEAAQSAGIE
jgi:acetolactate decarboxylase